MDADRFDALSRSLSSGHTRRTLPRLLGSLSLGGVLAALETPEALAAKRIGGAPCRSNTQCKTGRCVRGRCSCSQQFPTCKQPANVCETATCNSGRCRTTQACPGADCQCAVRYEADGSRSGVCYSRLLSDESLCQTDAECGFAGYDTCAKPEGQTTRACAAVEPCSCSSTADCPGVTTACQGTPGTCQPVCTAETCPGDDCDCAVRQHTDGSRSAVCYSVLDFGAGIPCDSDQHCGGSTICVVTVDQTECVRPGACANCATVTACA